LIAPAELRVIERTLYVVIPHRNWQRVGGEHQPADLSPQTSGLDEISHKILTALFYNGEFSVESLAQTTGIFEGLTKYHLDDLKKEGMIQRTLSGGVSFDALSSSATYDLTPEGREYVIKNLLKK